MKSLYFCDGELAILNALDFSYLPQLLLYSFIPSTIIAIGLSLFILFKDKFSLQSILLTSVALTFTLWSLNDTLQWVTVPAEFNLLFWQLTALFELSVPLSLYFFVRVFNEKKQSFHIAEKIGLTLLTLPAILLLPGALNISGFDLANCEGLVGPLIDYVHLVSAAFIILFVVYTFKLILLRKEAKAESKSMYTAKIIASLAAAVFVFIYTAANIIGETTKEYVVGLIAPLGMNLFLVFLMYAIVKFKAFNIKLAGAQALVFALVALIGSQLFFVETLANKILVSLTLGMSILGGFFLVRSVKKEIKQREQLEVLTTKLEKANVKLKELDKLKSEFVSIASHQLRSPLTAIRGYASMLAEGSFGKLPEKAQEPAERIEESAKLMATAVEDYLNVSRIESGNMKYNLSDFNLRDKVEGICDDLRPEALKHNLILIFRTDLKSRGVINADVGKTVQIIHNLINNSIKYTPKGTISVFIRDDLKAKKIFVEVTDTGIGMTQKTADSLFAKFSRADNANSVNVAGTGLGLFVARKMANAMNGDITVFSEGDGKGSRFTLEMPLAM